MNSVVPKPISVSSVSRHAPFPFSKQGVIFATTTSPFAKDEYPDLISFNGLLIEQSILRALKHFPLVKT